MSEDTPQVSSNGAEEVSSPVSAEGATEAEQLQATQITQEPGAGEGAPVGVYDDEADWPYRKLQAEAKGRDLDASGKREEIIARLVESDMADGVAVTGPSTGEDPNAGVENGGIGRNVEVSSTHADALQSMSDARRKAQLAAIEG